MLVLSRGVEDKIVFPNLGITVAILRVSGNRVRVGVDAPQDVKVLRHELAHTYAGDLNPADGASPSGSTESPGSTDHRQRNLLNNASLALSLAERQLNAGMHAKALVTLRRAMAQFDRLDAGAAPTDPAAADQAGRPHALLVDDDANESELLAGYLEMSGFQVDTAADGLQAMVHLGRARRPDVVLLDMHMPVMDGPETVRSIRAEKDLAGLRVFAVTGETAERSPVPIGPRGVDRWFTKPIKPQALVDSLHDELTATPAAS